MKKARETAHAELNVEVASRFAPQQGVRDRITQDECLRSNQKENPTVSGALMFLSNKAKRGKHCPSSSLVTFFTAGC